MGCATMIFLLVTMFVAAFSPASGITCNSCQADIHNNKTCEENNRVVHCEPYYDSCFTLTAVMNVPFLGERLLKVKNCSVSQYCPHLENITCSNLGNAVSLKKCEVKCCQGDLCNSGSGSVTTAIPTPGRRTTQPWWQSTTQPWWQRTTQPWWQRTTQPWWQRTTQPWWQRTTQPWWQTTRPWWQTTQPWWQTTRPWWQTTQPWWQTTRPWWQTTPSPFKSRLTCLLDKAQVLLFKIRSLLNNKDLDPDNSLSRRHKRNIDKVLFAAEYLVTKDTRTKRDVSAVEEIRKIKGKADVLLAKTLRK